MRKTMISILGIVLIVTLTGCSLSLAGTPTSLPTPTIFPSFTPTITMPTVTSMPGMPSATMTALPSVPATALPTFAPTPTSGTIIIPGSPSGPYAVILVPPGDFLNIRAGPGLSNPVIANFSATETNVMRTGSSAVVDGGLWVEVQKPGGGVGWVYDAYLTEYMASADFCANSSAANLITSLETALTNNDGVQLSSLVSSKHGMTVYLWRYGRWVTFMPQDARWVFHSTYEHNWGQAPASGLVTIGSFHIAVLPYLQEVFEASYTLTCNSLGSAPQYGTNPWPVQYANVNYYTVLKPGTLGIDVDFRYFLVGVEFIQGQPSIFGLVHFAWEP